MNANGDAIFLRNHAAEHASRFRPTALALDDLAREDDVFEIEDREVVIV